MIRRSLYKTASRLVLHPWYRLSRGMTLGARCLVVDAGGRVLLVRHGYAPGWLLPGGGVERGETIYGAARRELREEAAVEALEEPRLIGLYLNEAQFRGDHVAVLLVRQFRQHRFTANLEIAEAQFFDVAALPAETSPGTRRRIAEFCEERPPSPVW